MKKRTLIALLLLLGTVVLATANSAGGETTGEGHRVRGAAITMLEGGTGAPDFIPVLTKLAFHWNGSKGDLECLALAPSDPPGSPGSGDFDTNVMYVTGPVTAGSIEDGRAVLRGTATVTGLGAGEDLPFSLVAFEGGPGTRVILRVSGLVFKEIVLEGEIRF
ncbi:MAG: hypothetical protein ACRDHC_07430 [Actinomycetota bacterium]